jgi:thiamine-monophosphate kinase
VKQDRKSGEDALTDWLSRHAPKIGDDAAFLPAGGPWAITVDSQRAGVHFQSGLPARGIARRLVAVNNSDMAACGAAPRYAFSTLASPPTFDRKSFFRSLTEELARTATELAGGDLSSADQVEATLTLIGERVPRGRFLRRDAAQPGDRIWLGGTVGESRLGLALLARGARPGRPLVLPPELPARLSRFARRCLMRHLAPKPQLDLGHWFARRRRDCAAIDISDGLAKDLSRLCRASGVGCRLRYESLPRHRQFDRLADWLGIDPKAATLAGGEDYVLLVSAPPGISVPERFGCSDIGTILPPAYGTLIDASGRERQLSVYSELGFDHFPSSSEAKTDLDPSSD